PTAHERAPGLAHGPRAKARLVATGADPSNHPARAWTALAMQIPAQRRRTLPWRLILARTCISCDSWLACPARRIPSRSAFAWTLAIPNATRARHAAESALRTVT